MLIMTIIMIMHIIVEYINIVNINVNNVLKIIYM